MGEGAELLARDLLGHSLLYLLRGAPAVYYGDEVGMLGRGGDKAARQDLFPTSVTEWQTEERVGSAADRRLARRSISSHIPSRSTCGLSARSATSHPALSTGASFVRVAREGTLVVSRIDRDGTARVPRGLQRIRGRPRRSRCRRRRRPSSWRSLLGAGTASASLAERPDDGTDPTALRGAVPRGVDASAARAARA